MLRAGAVQISDRTAREPGHAGQVAQEDLAILAICVVVVTSFRAAALFVNGTDFFTDEAQYWSWSKELAFGYYSKPPLLAWLIAGATAICGDGEPCVRMVSTLLNAATSFIVFLIAAKLYSSRTGLWSALLFLTLPGISLSSQVISTDPPLLFFWSLALLAFIRLIEAPSLFLAISVGALVGLGANAKYAMAYFVPCAAIYLALVPEHARRLGLRHLAAATGFLCLVIAPNLIWNSEHAFVTVAHVSENASWSGRLFHPGRAAEFILSQFGVAGPIVFACYLALSWRLIRGWRTLSSESALLLSFSLPILVLVTVQGLLSHALPNWAAPAYVAGVVLATSGMVSSNAKGLLKSSLALSLVVLIGFAIAAARAGHFQLPGGHDPFARTLGNRELAAAVGQAMADAERGGERYDAIVADNRRVVAALLYYGQGLDRPILAVRAGSRPKDHYQLTRPCCPAATQRVLLATLAHNPGELAGQFSHTRPLGQRDVHAGSSVVLRVHLFSLEGYIGSKVR